MLSSNTTKNAVSIAKVTHLTLRVFVATLMSVPFLLISMGSEITAADRAVISADNKPIDDALLYPNLWLQASRELLNEYVGKRKIERGRVSESMFGTRYTGSQTTDGRTELVLVPSDDEINLRFYWNASINSSTRGRHSRAVIRSRSNTRVTATKLILLDENGWRSHPSVAHARTSSRITGVSVDGLFGRRIARRRAEEQRPQVNREAQRRTVRRVRNEMDHRIGELVARLQGQFESEAGDSLLTPSRFTKVVHRQTTSEHISLALLNARDSQSAAISEPPPLMEQGASADFAVRIHASSINNWADVSLAGKEVNAKEFALPMAGNSRADSASSKASEEEQQLLIHFEPVDPLHISFGNDRIFVRLSASSFTVGEKEIPGASVSISYQCVASDGALVGKREARPAVELASRYGQTSTKISARDQVFRSVLRKRFEAVFPEQLDLQSLPAVLSQAPLPPMKVEDYRLSEDWLSVEYQLAPEQHSKKSLYTAGR